MLCATVLSAEGHSVTVVAATHSLAQGLLALC